MPPDNTPTPYKFDSVAATNKIAEVTKNLKTFAGKKNVNPFMDIAKYVEPLNKRLLAGDKSEELFKSIMALKHEPELIQSCLENEQMMADQKKLPPAAAMGLNRPKTNVQGN